MLCRAKLSSVSQVGLDAATDSVLFFPTGGVSFWSGVDRARGSFGEPKVTPPFLVYTLSDVTSSPHLETMRPAPHCHSRQTQAKPFRELQRSNASECSYTIPPRIYCCKPSAFSAPNERTIPAPL